VVDLEFSEGFQLEKKMPAKLELTTKKTSEKVITGSLSHFLHARTLASSTTPKLTHCPYVKVILALRTIIVADWGAYFFRGGFY